MGTYRSRKTGRTVVLIVVGVAVGIALSQAVDWIGGWL